MKKRTWLKSYLKAISIGIGVVLSGTASADVVADIVKRGELRVAVQTQGPPVSFVDKNGERTGFAIEVVKMMADDMGVELKLLDYDWKGLIPAVRSGKADFLAADMTPNAKRSLVLNFTDPYMYSDIVLYSKDKHPYKTWQEACAAKITVGANQGATTIAILKEKCPGVKIKEFAGGGPAVSQALNSDRVDAGISEYASAVSYVAGNKGFKHLDGALYSGPLSFAMRPDETHLLTWMNNYFMLIKADGRLEKLSKYWMLSQDWKEKH